jgi:hypothetical protein
VSHETARVLPFLPPPWLAELLRVFAVGYWCRNCAGNSSVAEVFFWYYLYRDSGTNGFMTDALAIGLSRPSAPKVVEMVALLFPPSE